MGGFLFEAEFWQKRGAQNNHASPSVDPISFRTKVSDRTAEPVWHIGEIDLANRADSARIQRHDFFKSVKIRAIRGPGLSASSGFESVAVAQGDIHVHAAAGRFETQHQRFGVGCALGAVL